MIRTKADRLAVEQGCYFDETIPQKVTEFCYKFCTLQDGDRAGQPVKLLDWVISDIVAPLYGWLRPDGTRRFRRGSIWTPRKQTKTTTLAALSLWQLLEEQGAQVYVVSSTKDTAGHLYNYAASMVEANPALSKRLWVRRNLKVIEDKRQGSLLKVLSGDKVGKSGHNASCIFWDELAEIQNPEAWHRLYDAGAARKQPVWLSISTPQYDRYSLAFEQWQKARAIQQGRDLDTGYLSCVWGVPPEVDWQIPDNWWQWIPSFETVSKDYYLQQWANVQGNPRETARFRNLMLAQWVESLEGWLPYDRWQDCCHDVDEAELEGQSCFVGCDGAVSHLSSYVLLFPDTMTVLPRFFVPRDTAYKEDEAQRSTYKAWSQNGDVKLTDGDLFDWPEFRRSLIADSKRFDFIELGFDPYSLEGRCAELQDSLYCPVTAVQPTRAIHAPPTQHLERLVIGRDLRCKSNAVMTWCAANAAVSSDAHDRITLDRDKAAGRYDGIAALVIALQRYLELGFNESVIMPVLL